MAELADAEDLKSSVAGATCGFESHSPHFSHRSSVFFHHTEQLKLAVDVWCAWRGVHAHVMALWC